MIRRFALALPLLLAACGGAGSAPTSSGPTTGGSGEIPSAGPGAGTPPAATQAPGPMLPGPTFGVRNDTGEDLVAYAWWETRPNVPPPFPGQRWYNLAPLGRGVPPGGTSTLPLFEDGRPIYEPLVGMIVVRAYLRSGAVREAVVLHSPPTSAVWIVR